MASCSVFASIKEEFEAAKQSLEDVDDTIRKLTGRDPSEFRPVARGNAPPGIGASIVRVRDRSFLPPGRQNSVVSVEGPPLKRRLVGSAFSSRLPTRILDRQVKDDDSGEEEELSKKPTVQSSVVATQREVRTRKDTIDEQKSDKKGMERNRRMFGMILGTLQKFQSEESRRKEQAQKRAEIEQKLEEAAEREREELRKERQDLFVARREKKAQIRRLQQKLEIAKLHDEWETKQRPLLNFIVTKTRPPIMFLPASHVPESERRLKESQKRVHMSINAQRARIEEQLREIDELYKKGGAEEEEEEEMEQGETAGDKENRGPSRRESGTGDSKVVKEGSNNKGETELADDKIQPSENGAQDGDIPGPKASTEGEESTGKEPGSTAVTGEVTNEELDKRDEVLTSLGDQEFEPIYDD